MIREIEVNKTITTREKVSVEFPLYVLYEFYSDTGPGWFKSWHKIEADGTVREFTQNDDGKWEFEMSKESLRDLGEYLRRDYHKIPAEDYEAALKLMKSHFEAAFP